MKASPRSLKSTGQEKDEPTGAPAAAKDTEEDDEGKRDSRLEADWDLCGG